MMKYKDQIEKYLIESGGKITTSYCKENNIPTIYLSRLLKEGELNRVQKGIYITNDCNYDEYYFFQYQYKKAIFSYETALFILGQTDKIPWKMDVTVYNGYKFNEKHPYINVNYVNKSIYNLGIIQRKTMFGNIVNIYSYEPTLCDFVSKKEKMDNEVYIKLLRSYSKFKDKDIHSLYEISKKMGIEDSVSEVMELVYE